MNDTTVTIGLNKAGCSDRGWHVAQWINTLTVLSVQVLTRPLLIHIPANATAKASTWPRATHKEDPDGVLHLAQLPQLLWPFEERTTE